MNAAASAIPTLRRNVPVHVVVVDTPANVQPRWPIGDLVIHNAGLVTSELVLASHAFASDRGPQLRLAAAPTSPGR